MQKIKLKATLKMALGEVTSHSIYISGSYQRHT